MRERFLEEYDAGERTLQIYGKHLDYLDQAGLNPAEVDGRQFRAYARERGWSNATARQALCAAKAYQKWLHGADYPLKGFKIRREQPPPQPSITEEQKDRLVRALDPQNQAHRQYLIAIMVLWDTWIRASELCRLRVADLHLDEGYLSVLTKGSEWEDKALSDETVCWLRAWLIERPFPFAPTVFMNLRSGKPWTRDGLRANLMRIGKRAGLHVSPHMFRRGGLEHQLKQGMSTRMAQIQGGWKDIRMVERYSRRLRIQDVRKFLNGKRNNGKPK